MPFHDELARSSVSTLAVSILRGLSAATLVAADNNGDTIRVKATTATREIWRMKVSLDCSAFRESCIDGLAVRHLTLPRTAARHPRRGVRELKIATHVHATRSAQVGNDTAGVLRDEVGSRAPIVPTTPAALPTDPQGPEAIDRGVTSDLKVLPSVGRAV